MFGSFAGFTCFTSLSKSSFASMGEPIWFSPTCKQNLTSPKMH